LNGKGTDQHNRFHHDDLGYSTFVSLQDREVFGFVPFGCTRSIDIISNSWFFCTWIFGSFFLDSFCQHLGTIIHYFDIGGAAIRVFSKQSEENEWVLR
jgi:hypothetical protein